jgi:hypothetical protein
MARTTPDRLKGECTVNVKRWIFGGLAAALGAGILLVPSPAAACDRCHRKKDDCSYSRRHSRYDHDYYRPRREVYYRSYSYRDSYRDDDCYRPRYSSSRHRCGDCGKGFDSSYWLTYHHRHSGCD